MRAAAVLALVLSFLTPPVVWSSAPEVSAKAGASAMASPAASASALVRHVAKAEKTFSSDWAAALDPQPHYPTHASAVAHTGDVISLAHLALDSPPLAPRPPPVA